MEYDRVRLGAAAPLARVLGAASTVIVLLLTALTVEAQVTSEREHDCDCYGLTAWTIESGLPAGTVLAIAQDRTGYLWLGTSEGLIRFDGDQFTEWRDTGAPTLPGTSVSALIASRDDSLWIAFSDIRGVTRAGWPARHLCRKRVTRPLYHHTVRGLARRHLGWRSGGRRRIRARSMARRRGQ